MDASIVRHEDGNTNWKETLERFYREHNPSKVSGVSILLKQFAGQEEDLWDVLQDKYILKTPAPACVPQALDDSISSNSKRPASPRRAASAILTKQSSSSSMSRLLAPTASFSMKAAGECHSDLTILRVDRSKAHNRTLGIISDGTTVEEVLPHSAADKAGVVPGMTLVSLNGKTFTNDDVTIKRVLRNTPLAFSLAVRLPESPAESQKVVYSSNPIHVLCSSHPNRARRTASAGLLRDTAVTSGRKEKRDTTWAERDFWPPAAPKWVPTKKPIKSDRISAKLTTTDIDIIDVKDTDDRVAISPLNSTNNSLDQNDVSDEAPSPPPSTAVDKSPSGSRPGSRTNSPVAKFGYSASPKADPPKECCSSDKSLPRQSSPPPSASPEPGDSSPPKEVETTQSQHDFELNEQLAEDDQLQRDLSVELPPPPIRTVERIDISDIPPSPRQHSPTPVSQSSISRESSHNDDTTEEVQVPSPVPVPVSVPEPVPSPEAVNSSNAAAPVTEASQQPRTRRKLPRPAVEMRQPRRRESAPLSPQSDQPKWNSVMTAGIRGPLTQVEKFELALRRKGEQKRQAFNHFRKVKEEEEKLAAIENRILRDDEEREKRLQAKMREFEELKQRQNHVHTHRLHSSRISSRRPTL
eukprot:TRINITY_DN5084_c3_g1_i1.p1 TRINITY_DN5084_c3_g1~~TRINITY_DN5084_c3_g1_i1.p1  ORF type:complete len:653 (+),score=145.89 TRINITY_DN5084_c3_g1_i1:45-1961(+)